MALHMLSALGLSLGSLLGPANPSSGQSDEIVVEGARSSQEALKQFVDALTDAPAFGRIARFEQPFCPVAIGFSAKQEQTVEDRIRRVAKAAEVKVAKQRCGPNALLIVTPNKAALISDLLAHYPYLFPRDWRTSRIRQLAADPAPTAAWQVDQLVGSDGQILGEASITDPGRPLPRSPAAVQFTTGATSRIKSLARKRLIGTVVVIDSQALDGLTTSQIADYAALRLLVRTDPKDYRQLGGSTILNAVEAPMGTAVPLTATAWDMRFLKAFYASRKDSYAEGQRSEIRWLMRRESARPQR